MGIGCPNLRKLFGERFKISWEESRQGRAIDPWLYVIKGRYGHIYPWGPDTLAVWTDRSKTTVNRLVKAGCALRQDGDREWTLAFPVHLFPLVAKAIQAYRKRKMTKAQRDALYAQAMRNKASSSSTQTPFSAQERTQSSEVDI